MKEELTHQESLDLITEMIKQAKRNVAKGGSKQILLWGWTIALANFGHYFLAMAGIPSPYIIWLITIPAAVTSAVIGTKMRQRGATGHIDSVYAKVWIAAGVSIVICLSMMHKINFNHNAVILLIAGMGMFITGSLLRFTPILLGSFVLWLAALISFNLPEIQQYIVAGSAIILGYLIPGYLLKRAERG
ncbi:hypothetical protein RT717_15070 [Imperialibacter roseus]|uniref:Transmembrane protein n=1 Tax=Imperialibacter roseus TaxID=1324217 RepID=A0ABZ0IJA9_9BACT|nr:hypothetical protein [Imperialibacter roseus]WOK04400.1 hypothetical protein RT717_15070 [Imperialibacter roseus]